MMKVKYKKMGSWSVSVEQIEQRAEQSRTTVQGCQLAEACWLPQNLNLESLKYIR